MKAWQIKETHSLELNELSSQSVNSESVKVKILSSAISRADIDIYNGALELEDSLILGRQAVGFISETGNEVKNLARGNRVVMYPFASCKQCLYCKSGKSYNCENHKIFGQTKDGFFKDFAVVAQGDMYLIPERLSDHDAIFTEHVAMALNTLLKLDVQKGEHLVIIGATAFGVILAQVAIYYQAIPVLVDTDSSMLEIAQNLGIYYTSNSVDEDPFKRIFSLTGSKMADAVVYVSQSSMPFTRAIAYSKIKGKMAIVGKDSKIDIKTTLNDFVNKSMSLISVTDCGKNYATAINLLSNKSIVVSPLIKQEILFDDLGEYIKNLEPSPKKTIVKH